MDEERYLPSFDMIMHAGNSRAQSMLAIEAAREFDFETAREHLRQAEENLAKAHDAQTQMMGQEASGNPVEVHIILVHSQDHLTMAMMAKDLAEELLAVYQMMEKLKGEIEK